jgi:trehalose/maltose hydrolase-like predicted phosphorylase
MTPLVCVPCREYEQHITGDVAFAARQYWAATRDVTWLTSQGGLDLLSNTADFWTSRAEWNAEMNRYELNGEHFCEICALAVKDFFSS